MTSDEDRWAQAQSLLDGTASEAVQRRLHRAQRLQLLLLVVVLAVVFGGMFALGVFSDSDAPSDSDDAPLWRLLAGLLVMLAGLVLAFPAAVRQVRGNMLRDNWRSPLLALRIRQRRHLLREVMGRVPADPAHVPLARHLATSLARQTVEPRLALGVLLLAIGQLISTASWFWAAVVVLLVGARPLMRRRTRRVQGFLDAHAVESAP